MYRQIKSFLNYLISGVINHTDSKKSFGRSVYQKFKDKIMVAPVIGSSSGAGNMDYNDPVRRQLIETKRAHAAKQKKDYSHVFR